MQSNNLSAHASYNPHGSSGPMPISENLLETGTTKQSKGTEFVQQQLAEENPYLILEAEDHEKFISFSFKIDKNVIEAIALITKPEKLQALKTKNIISVYLFTKDFNSMNTENRLDLKPEYIEEFKKRIIEAIYGSAEPFEDPSKISPADNDRSSRTKALHKKETLAAAA